MNWTQNLSVQTLITILDYLHGPRELFITYLLSCTSVYTSLQALIFCRTGPWSICFYKAAAHLGKVRLQRLAWEEPFVLMSSDAKKTLDGWDPSSTIFHFFLEMFCEVNLRGSIWRISRAMWRWIHLFCYWLCTLDISIWKVINLLNVVWKLKLDC